MRKSFALALVGALMASSSALVLAQQQSGALAGVARSADQAPMPGFRIQVRNANTGVMAGMTTSNQAGEFSFNSLVPGNYVVEIIDASGRVVGLSPSITVGAGATVKVTVGATAAGALSSAEGAGVRLFGMGPLATVAVAGAASAAAVTAVVSTRNGKTLICQKISATESRTIEVSPSELDQYQGATLGPCPASPSR